VAGIVGDDGVIALPTMPTAAPRLDASESELEQFRSRALSMLCTAGLAGLPQISLPLAEVGGLPLGVSLIGPAGRDKALIALARRILAD
jgi:amidase